MTKLSDTAPERIWANSSYGDNYAYGWWRNGPFEAADEYIRKDISDARIVELEVALEEAQQDTDAMVSSLWAEPCG